MDNPNFGLKDFAEMELKFAPTFKYDRGSVEYDTSEKQRVPSYCDRILYKGTRIKQHSLLRLECKMSDHRPVYGLFSVQNSKIDQMKYREIEKAVEAEVSYEFQELAHNRKLDWIVGSLRTNADEASNLLLQCGGDIRHLMKKITSLN